MGPCTPVQAARENVIFEHAGFQESNHVYWNITLTMRQYLTFILGPDSTKATNFLRPPISHHAKILIGQNGGSFRHVVGNIN
jgi:hypothetical protein